jgi:chromosome segregation ATPase
VAKTLRERAEAAEALVKELAIALKRSQKERERLKETLEERGKDLSRILDRVEQTQRERDQQAAQLREEKQAHAITQEKLGLANAAVRRSREFLSGMPLGLTEADRTVLLLRMADAEDAVRRVRSLFAGTEKGWRQRCAKAFGKESLPEPTVQALMDDLKGCDEDGYDEDD